MFGFFPRLAVERPVLTTMLLVLLVVLGTFALTRLQTDLFPEVEFPVVSISTAYPGAGPEEIETQVTDRIEEAVAALAGIETLRSYSQENVSIVVVEFSLGTSPDQAAIDVRDRIEAIRGDLPTEVEPPVVQKFDLRALPIMNLALFGPQGTDALFEFADRDLRTRLSRVPGVATVQISGGREREVEVLAAPERLQAFGLTLADLVDALQAENVSVPSGRIVQPAVEVPVRVTGEYRSVAELRELRLPLAGGQVVRLGEVAEVREGFEDVRQIVRYQGEPAVGIAIQRGTDANPVATADGVRAELERVRGELAAGAEIVVIRDQTEFIRESVRDVLTNLLIGMLLTTVVLFVFLHSWRGTIIAAAAMPTTVIATFLAIDVAGFTLNTLTLMALSVTVGILVTNTIVVLENVYRRLDAGDEPRVAAERGTTEIALAVAASTLTNLVVFTPIAFMGGVIGQFFFAFGLTVVFATVFSIFVSFTLAPLLAARLLRPAGAGGDAAERALAPVWRRWNAGYGALEQRYRGALGWALARPRNGWVVIAAVLAFSAATLLFAGRFVGGEFLPQADEGAIRVELELPTGTPVERTSELVLAAERALRALPDVASLLATAGAGGDGFMSVGGGANTAELLVTLREDARPTETVVREIRARLADLPDVAVTAVPIDPGAVGGNQAPVQLQISGPDYAVLTELSARAASALAGLPQLSDVDDTVEAPRRELVFRPDRAVLADHGLTVGEVGRLVRASIEGEVAGVYRGEIGRERDIRVRLVPDARSRAEQLAELQVRTQRGVVPVAALGEIVEADSPTTIARIDRVRTVEVTAQIGAGTLTDAVAAIRVGMEGLGLPPGYAWRVGGDFEQFEESLAAMLVALLLAVTLTYIVLAMVLESFVHPITIMITLPLGAVGAVLALFLAGVSLNIFSMMALIMLVGIVVNNAILILEYAGRLRRAGRAIGAALLEAAPARLRPIVMSNVAITFALLPQAFATGSGGSFSVPMAVVTIGGVLLSAVFTLLLIPVIYVKLDRFAHTPEGPAPASAAEIRPGGATPAPLATAASEPVA